jgi:E3 ubiquitin-protein ligase HERC4
MILISSCFEIVFSSQACLNCSFLLPNDEHYCCTLRNHGVCLPLAEQCFAAIAQGENNSIKELVSTEHFFPKVNIVLQS